MLRKSLLALLLIYSGVTTYLLLQQYQSFNSTNLPKPNPNLAAEIQASNKAQPNIILNAIPKSGSAYIAQALENGLGYKHFKISNEYIPQDHLNYQRMQTFFNGGAHVSKQHMDPSGINIQILKRFTDRMVLNVRDPRECLLSWVHHLNSEHAKGIDVYYVHPEPPAGYYDLSLQQQIDWNIEHFLPGMVQWLQAWVQFKQHEDAQTNGLKILITKYDELLTDEKALYSKILAFYNIPESNFTYKPTPKSEYLHFRKGDPNEWRTVFTQEQQQKIAQVVPQNLLDHFGWKN